MPSTHTTTTANFALCLALLSASSIALLTIVGALATPGYSHVSQFISELGARGAINENTVRFAGFLPAGIFLLLYCVAARRCLPVARGTTAALVGIALYALGYVVAAFLPCDPGCRPVRPSVTQAIHNAVGLIGYVAAPWFLLALARSARTWPNAKLLEMWGYGGAVVALVGLLTLSPLSPFVGISQRAIEAAVLSWVVASGLYIHAQMRARSLSGSTS